MNWFALTVKWQHERVVVQHLEGKLLDAYSPFYRSRRRWSDRMKVLELPLFSGYVFCHMHIADYFEVLNTPSVLSVVGFGGKPTPVPDVEIEAVKALVGSGLPVAPWRCLHIGQRVRICEGPLSGMGGILAREKSGYRVVVNVDLLQRAVAVEVDRDFVKVIDGNWPPIADSQLSRTVSASGR
jgi:transcription antitermination factor NusG